MHLASRNQHKEITPFINKTLSKEMMKRTRLRNKILKDRNYYNKREIQNKGTTVCLPKRKKSYR